MLARVEVQHHGVRRVLFVRQEMQLQGGPSLRERGVRGGMQHAQDGAVKLETDSRGEQRLGEKFAFVRVSVSDPRGRFQQLVSRASTCSTAA